MSIWKNLFGKPEALPIPEPPRPLRVQTSTKITYDVYATATGCGSVPTTVEGYDKVVAGGDTISIMAPDEDEARHNRRFLSGLDFIGPVTMQRTTTITLTERIDP